MKALLWNVLCASVLALALVPAAHAGRPSDVAWSGWDAGLHKAAASGKPVLVDVYTDWCGWCIKLNKEVFSKPEFAKYAKDNLVLVEVDFPRRKQQSEEMKKANQALQEKYKIEGYPTIIVLNGEGKKVGDLSYMDSPKPFIAKLEEMKKKG